MVAYRRAIATVLLEIAASDYWPDRTEAANRLGLLQVKGVRPEVDDAVMPIQDLRPEQSNRWWGKLQRFVQNPAQVHHAYIVPADVDHTHRHFPDPRHIQSLFLEIDRRRREPGLFSRNV